ncbi:MAG: hypothetical protein GTN59_11750, partial [Candidatus Dadabacteria bacterium]|nr:hypothetical protein [Candidatus Dadabacteria bacterium]
MGDLEEKISEKKFSFSIKDLRWIIGIVITIIGWGVTAYLWVQDKSEMKEEIVTLGSENKLLNEKVIRLEGQV